MTDRDRYLMTKWRKSLERRGWKNAKRFPVLDTWVEYHAIWQGRIFSGRYNFSQLDGDLWWVPGSPVWLLKRGLDVDEAVWRRSRKETEGQIVRDLSVILARPVT